MPMFDVDLERHSEGYDLPMQVISAAKALVIFESLCTSMAVLPSCKMESHRKAQVRYCGHIVLCNAVGSGEDFSVADRAKGFGFAD